NKRPDIWLTYHSYYKAPDVIGPLCCRLLNIPYVIFQGIYSTKRRKKIKTWAGFYLNRMALCQAVCIFSNKRPDYKNLQRLVPADRLMYIAPGLHPSEFTFDAEARKKIRLELHADNRLVVMTAAMFRPGVKTRGVLQVIESCGRLVAKGYDPLLLIAGDGIEKEKIIQAATDALGESAVLLGRLSRGAMKDYYSGADIFAFPGIEESLGMVFLEAQACGLPVVACSDWGASEAVVDGETGLLSRAAEKHIFDHHLEQLAGDEDLRRRMGKAAAHHVRQIHDIERNYAVMLHHLQEIAAKNHGREIVDLK
nr:glycosyltransferase family 4 protein [Desulfocapsaceae bacterium]